MARPMWFVKIIRHYFPNRFAIAETTKKSVIMRKLIDYLLFEKDEIYYLPKEDVFLDQTNEKRRVLVDQNIDLGEETALPSEIVRHFIEEANNIWLMDKCICRESNDCKDYPIDIGCIFLGDAVLGINPKLGRLATKQEALDRLQKAIDLGLVHMIGRNKIDTQWMGIGPGEKLLSICHCCPCCCLYRVLPSLDETISSRITKIPGLQIYVIEEECIGCGICANDICVTNSIQIVNEKAVIDNLCLGCGRCVEVCPTDAIVMEITDEHFIDTTIKRISQRVDVK
jgi:ferredoxin